MNEKQQTVIYLRNYFIFPDFFFFFFLVQVFNCSFINADDNSLSFIDMTVAFDWVIKVFVSNRYIFILYEFDSSVCSFYIIGWPSDGMNVVVAGCVGRWTFFYRIYVRELEYRKATMYRLACWKYTNELILTTRLADSFKTVSEALIWTGFSRSQGYLIENTLKKWSASGRECVWDCVWGFWTGSSRGQGYLILNKLKNWSAAGRNCERTKFMRGLWSTSKSWDVPQ